MIQFLPDADDDRAIFANITCKMLFNKYAQNLDDKSLHEELKTVYNYFNEYVRNIYEVIDTEIPLFLFARFLRYGDRLADDYDMTTAEFLKVIKEGCIAYYGGSNDITGNSSIN